MQPLTLRALFGVVLLVSATVPAAVACWLLLVTLPDASAASARRSLELALSSKQSAIEAHLRQAHRALDSLLPDSISIAAGTKGVRSNVNSALLLPMASAWTRASPDIRSIYFRSSSGSIQGVENAIAGFSSDGRGAMNRDTRSASPMPLTAPLKSVSAGEESPAPRDQSPPTAATQTSDRIFSPVNVYSTDRQLVMTLSQPVRGEAGALLGILGVDLSLFPLDALIRSQPASPQSVAFLVNEKGFLLASSVGNPILGNPGLKPNLPKPDDSENLELRAAYRALENHWSVAPESRDMAQPAILTTAGTAGPAFVSFANVGRDLGLQWTLIVSAPEADFVQASAGLADAAVVALLVWMAALAVLAWCAAAGFGQRLNSLGRAIQQLAEGNTPIIGAPTYIREFNNVLARLHKTAVALGGKKSALPPGTSSLPSDVQTDNKGIEALGRELVERSRELAFARDRAAVALRSKADVIAAISHELRTPLNGIVGMTTLLANTDLDEEQRDYLDSLLVSGNRLLSVVDGILDFSHSGSGEIALQIAPFEVRAVVEAACALAAKSAYGKGLRLLIDVPGRVRRDDGAEVPWVILGDAARFAQVVGELVGNAVKFTETGHVIVQLRPVPGATRIDLPMLEGRVTDSGPGIAAEQVRDVFSAVSQLDSSSSRRHEGAGIGLATCKKLVDLMGGRLDLQSQAGKGSTFKFTALAPWAAVRPAPQSAQAEAQMLLDLPHGQQTAQVTILVVDDNPINLKVACAMLAKFGYEVITAEGGQQAVDCVATVLARGERLGAIVMDVHMPEVDGVQATQAIRAAHGENAPPIIALTAGSSVKDCQRCLDAGMVEYLTKPLQMAALAATLERWVWVQAPPDLAAGALPGARHQSVLFQQTIHLPRPRAESSIFAKDSVRSGQQEVDTKAAPAMPAERDLVDFHRLAEFREFDDAKLTMTHEVIALLINEVPIRLAAMDRAIELNDFRGLARAAHSLRGASSNVGAVEVQRLCGSLEQDTIEAKAVPADVAIRVAALRTAWMHTRPLLEGWD